MEGDFTRNSDDPERGYSGVLMQQGRVQLDADWNEQWAIYTRALRLALRDIIGQHGGPADDWGFRVQTTKPGGTLNPELIQGDFELFVDKGTYYVDGIRLTLREWWRVETGIVSPSRGSLYLAYLEVWERHVNAIEDPALREVALLGPDTATRSEVVWRVNLLRDTDDNNRFAEDEISAEGADKIVRRHLRDRSGLKLAARARTDDATTDPCKLAPGAHYRGPENQLYRVEIHRGVSEAAFVNTEPAQDQVLFSFKWSRENGSVIFPIVHYGGPATVKEGAEVSVTVKVAHLGRDARFGLTPGDIVEFVHDGVTRGGTAVHDAGRDDLRTPGALGRVTAIDPETLDVTVAVIGSSTAEICALKLHPYLRRWDHGASGGSQKLDAGAIPVTLEQIGTWLPLEDGVEVCFEKRATEALLRVLRARDFWMIPARAATGDVLWPTEEIPDTKGARGPKFQEPHGIVLHYAPLAFVTIGAEKPVTDVRKLFEGLARPPAQ